MRNRSPSPRKSYRDMSRQSERYSRESYQKSSRDRDYRDKYSSPSKSKQTDVFRPDERLANVKFGARSEHLAQLREQEEAEKLKNITIEQLGQMDENEALALMGIPNGFQSTKGKHVEGNCPGYIAKRKARVYRQYMNRVGGYNRPLDPI